MTKRSNIERLTAAGVIPKGYSRLTDAEKAAIDNLTADEVEAIISSTAKMDPDFLAKHAPHGMLY